MDPVPVRSQPSLRVEMTRKRLWFLFHLASLSKREIEEITGWTRKEIDRGLDKWDLRTLGPTWRNTSVLVNSAVARLLGIDQLSALTFEGAATLRVELRDQLRHMLTAGPIKWTKIDAFPWPEEIADPS